MRYLLVFVVILSAMLCPVAYADNGVKHFSISLPDNWRDAARIRLVLKDVEAPGNVPFKLRVTISSGNGKEVRLGTVGIPAISRTNAKTRSIPVIRLDVTRALQQYLADHPDTGKIELSIQPVSARNQPIEDLAWSLKEVLFEPAD